MVTYGFYNSVNYDRRYNAEQISSIFDGIINDGVYMSIGNAFIVEGASSGLAVTVGSGRAWFNHTWTVNDAAITLTLETAPTYGTRIDAIVLEIDRENRRNTIKVVKGTAASSPSRPTLVVGDTLAQYPLAYVTIGTDASAISSSMITNMVGTSSCPFVTGIIDTISIDRLVAQWESEWQDYYDSWSSKMNSLYDNWTAKFVIYNNKIDALEEAIEALDGKINTETAKLSKKLEDIETLQRTDFEAYMAGVKADAKALYDKSVVDYGILKTETEEACKKIEKDAEDKIDAMIIDTDALIEVPLEDILAMWEDD